MLFDDELCNERFVSEEYLVWVLSRVDLLVILGEGGGE